MPGCCASGGIRCPGIGSFLTWEGPDGEHHRAYYTGAAGCPVLMVDQDTVRLTMAEVIGLGLVRVTRGGARKE